MIGMASEKAIYRGLPLQGAESPVIGAARRDFPAVRASAPLAGVALAFSGERLVDLLTYDSLNHYLERERRHAGEK